MNALRHCHGALMSEAAPSAVPKAEADSKQKRWREERATPSQRAV